MAYAVEIARAALRDAEEYYDFILKRSYDQQPADEWWSGLLRAVDSLETLPTRCPKVPEQKDYKFPLYHLLYASHRLVFRIQPKTVRILRIYHGSLRPLRNLHQRPRLPGSR